MDTPLSIAMVASEATPYAKTGGLADVVGALSRTLASRGHSVCLILPLYREVLGNAAGLVSTQKKIKVPISGKPVEGEIFQCPPEKNLQIFFIKQDRYFDREGLYGTAEGDFGDNAERFIFLSRAVPRILEKINFKPDIVHCHDWQTGLVPAYLGLEEKENPLFRTAKTLFTIHNMAFQGLFWHLDMHLTGLPWSAFTADGLEYYGKISFLKAGIVYSDAISTVSKKYAEEIQSPEYGCGFDGILRARAKNLFGILNGVDYDHWNPETDGAIPQRYSIEDLSGKKGCKRDLIREFGLECDENTPIFSVVSRLTDQKGIDLILGASDEIEKRGGALLILGVGEPRYHFWLQEAEKRNSLMRVRLTFDEALAHKIEAGSDFFLMPSKFEPCGLNQLYSLKYGTPPIVRATGGLDDSIQNFNPSKLAGNGFKFAPYDVRDLVEKIDEALRVYRDEKSWRALLKNAMLSDYSWEQACQEYEKRYREMLNVRTAQRPGGGAVGHHLHRTRQAS